MTQTALPLIIRHPWVLCCLHHLVTQFIIIDKVFTIPIGPGVKGAGGDAKGPGLMGGCSMVGDTHTFFQTMALMVSLFLHKRNKPIQAVDLAVVARSAQLSAAHLRQIQILIHLQHHIDDPFGQVLKFHPEW